MIYNIGDWKKKVRKWQKSFVLAYLFSKRNPKDTKGECKSLCWLPSLCCGMFMAKCNNVPVTMFPHTSLSILGLTKEDIVPPSDIWKSAPDLAKVASQLETHGYAIGR